MACLATRLDRLEHALGDAGGGAACPVCAARPLITGPWTPEREPEQCPRCGVPWRREAFSLNLCRSRRVGTWGDETGQ